MNGSFALQITFVKTFCPKISPGICTVHFDFDFPFLHLQLVFVDGSF